MKVSVVVGVAGVACAAPINQACYANGTHVFCTPSTSTIYNPNNLPPPNKRAILLETEMPDGPPGEYEHVGQPMPPFKEPHPCSYYMENYVKLMTPQPQAELDKIEEAKQAGHPVGMSFPPYVPKHCNAELEAQYAKEHSVVARDERPWSPVAVEKVVKLMQEKMGKKGKPQQVDGSKLAIDQLAKANKDHTKAVKDAYAAAGKGLTQRELPQNAVEAAAKDAGVSSDAMAIFLSTYNAEVLEKASKTRGKDANKGITQREPPQNAVKAAAKDAGVSSEALMIALLSINAELLASKNLEKSASKTHTKRQKNYVNQVPDPATKKQLDLLAKMSKDHQDVVDAITKAAKDALAKNPPKKPISPRDVEVEQYVTFPDPAKVQQLTELLDEAEERQTEPVCHFDPKSKHSECFGGAHPLVGNTQTEWPEELGPKPPGYDS